MSNSDPRSQAHRSPTPKADPKPQAPQPHTPGVPAQHQNTPTYPQTDRPVYTPEQVPLGGPPAQTPPAR
jgi:hypothetical protein